MKTDLTWFVTGPSDLPGSQKGSRLRALLKYKMPMFLLDVLRKEIHSHWEFESSSVQRGQREKDRSHLESV